MITIKEPVFAWYFGILAGILGAVFGSFLNCFAWRIAHDEKIWKGRSHCPTCGHTLNAVDLIPVFGWIIRGGKCHYCKTKISPRYLFAELFMAGMFVWTVFSDDITVLCLRDLIFLCILFTISLVDLEIYIIPNMSHIIAIVLYFATVWFISDDPVHTILMGLLGMVLLGGGVMLIAFIMEKILKKPTLGGGDVKLLGVTGLFLGPMRGLFGLVLACICGILFAAIGNALGRKKNEEDPARIPFGPSISFGMFVMLLCGQPLVDWYLSLF